MPLAESRLEVLQVRKLINCVRMKETAAIRKLIENGIHGLINYQDPENGETALHVAVTHNQESLVNLLLELGAHPLVGDKNGQNSVMRACEYGHLQSLQAMAVRGVNAAVPDKKGKTALFYCLHPTMRHAKCIDFLLECGADPNTLDSTGIPILCAASQEGLQRIVERILDRGADPNAKEKSSGKPAVMLAAEGNHVECLKLLLKGGANKNAVDRMGNCAVHRAATLCHFEALQVLSAYGADFTIANNDQQTAMHLTIPSSNLVCIRFLGQRGCPANEPNSEGNTPQKLAKSLGFKDCMKELKKLTTFQDKILKGGKPKGYAEKWCVQLYDWITVNKVSVSELLRSHDEGGELVGNITTDNFVGSLKLLQCPVNNDENISKLSAIYDKAKHGRINYDDLLEEHKYVHAQYKFGKNDDLKAKKGKKKGGKKGGGKKGGKTKIKFPIPFDIEEPINSGGCEGTIEKEQYITDTQRFSRDKKLPHQFVDDSAWYLAFPNQQYLVLYEAVRHSDLCSLESALASGIPVDHRDKYNKTPLMIACSHGRKDVVQLLLNNGADVNAADNFLWTPLHHACHSGEEDIAKLLLAAGANVDAQSASGGTALMRAIESSQKSIVKLLLGHGAKVTPENLNELTALDVARNWGDDYIYAIMYAKAGASQTTSASDKKGKGDKKGKDSKGKKKDSKEDKAPAICLTPAPLPPLSQLPTVQDHVTECRRKLSLSKFKPATTIKPYPNYKPRPAWISRPPSTESFLETQQQLREEKGISNVDFNETKSPFQLNILARVQALD